VIHWVSASTCRKVQVRLYDRLYTRERLDDLPPGEDANQYLNPNSLEVIDDCRIEPSAAEAQPGQRFQFERLGYFCVDSRDSQPGQPVFNRTVPLRDTWAKIDKANKSR